MKKKQTADRELGNRSFLSKIEPYLYLLPFAIGIAVFTLYPVINVVLMSFKEGYSHLSRNFDQWGLANYQTVINDPKFAQAIGNTFCWLFRFQLASLLWLHICSIRNCAFLHCSRRRISCRWLRRLRLLAWHGS